MMGDDLKRRVREANNILDVITSYVGRLQRAGRNYKACCPFHREKSASFNINPEGQFFKCFGCGKSGDVFTFVMLYERVEFPEALRILAERAGIPVEFDPAAIQQHKKDQDWKSFLFKLNDQAKRFFREQLFSNAGKMAREYVKKRGLNDEICENFEIGYAPAGGSPLLARLTALRAPHKAVVAAGLATQRDDGSVRDFFYDRLMFPIHDMQGRVIAFGGRILGDGEPKYLNTRDTALFSKTKTVYAIDRARDTIIDSKRAVLVEGYTDVMMCHQFGVTNVVACLGTAITPEHVQQLRRVADEVVLLTDSDAAGARASERSITVLFQSEMPAKVARLPGGDKDPCDFLLAQGKAPFLEALGHSRDLFEFKFERASQAFKLDTPQGIRDAVNDLMGAISLIPDPLLRNRYRSEISRRLNVPEGELKFVAGAAAAPRETEEPLPELGAVPPAESKVAQAEREVLKFLFHEPAWLEQTCMEVDLSGLNGAPERVIGQALLGSLGDGILPPDTKLLTDTDAGSLVAREVLQRLGEDGAESARSLTIFLAEERPLTSKLEARARLNMLVLNLHLARLNTQHDTANLRLTKAKVDQDRQAEAKAYEDIVAVRREIAKLKSSLGR